MSSSVPESEEIVFAEEDVEALGDPWKVLVVDDDSETHRVTNFALKGYTYGGRPLDLVSVYSAEEAKKQLRENRDFAVILLDVVMEEYDSGLKLVEYIRKEIKDEFVRIILRTGQPGHAPEYHVIRDYDINDYKNKTELTDTRLYTSITTALRSYHHLLMVDQMRNELEQKVIARTRELATKNEDLEKALDSLSAEQERARRLLLNILPENIAQRMTSGEEHIVDHFEEVSVLFADIVNFTSISRKAGPKSVVAILDTIFSEFDRLTEEYKLEKIKTIGDCYMVVGGLPVPDKNHLEKVADIALRFRNSLPELRTKLGYPLQLRIGLHTGNVVAGVIGRKRFIYDLWGDTVNMASRMEQYGVADQVHCSHSVFRKLHESYEFEYRGLMNMKGCEPQHSYFLTGKKNGF